MPTFQNPIADSEEAREALRGLAHATRVFDDPSATYEVIGELLAGVRSLGQVLEQLANAHLRHQLLAHIDTEDSIMGAPGVNEALAAVDELRHAAKLVDAAGVHLDRASQYSGRISWYPHSRRSTVEANDRSSAPSTPAIPLAHRPKQPEQGGPSL